MAKRRIYKWIGAGLGAFSGGGPIGAIAGFLVGALIDKALIGDEEFQQTGSASGDFALSIAVLSVAIMKSDGKMVKSELEYVKRYFLQQFGEDKAKEMLLMMRELKERDVSVRQVCIQLRGNLTHPMRLQLMHFLMGVANADGQIEQSELTQLHTCARYLGISQKDFISLLAMYGASFFNKGNFYNQYRRSSGQAGGRQNVYQSQSTVQLAYTVLEIESNVSDDEVKKAYRKLAKKHHPDRVASLGEEFQKSAKLKFQKIQESYEIIKKHRGMN